ncbi:MAG TPA: hypothetical protein VE261_06920 [Gaiellaceae bacterium]|jgi:hypothetical protein|nr:hypothetical protein [Gaiellaceae bacterium]
MSLDASSPTGGASVGTAQQGAGGGNGGGTCPLTIVEHKVIAVETDTVTFNSGLNGDTDGLYRLVVRGIGGSNVTAALGVLINFNGDVSGANHYRFLYNRIFGISPTATTEQLGGFATAGGIAGFTGLPGDAWSSDLTLQPKSGAARICWGTHANDNLSSANGVGFGQLVTTWHDSVSILSQITLVSSTAGLNVFGVGSELTLFKQALS